MSDAKPSDSLEREDLDEKPLDANEVPIEDNNAPHSDPSLSRAHSKADGAAPAPHEETPETAVVPTEERWLTGKKLVIVHSAMMLAYAAPFLDDNPLHG